MADEEHFSLCWNNFNTNLSTGFHESLCRGDLVDVTLVAEGQMVKAHRLVLSVCSPLFREMFAAMQPNQQAFVVLPNIKHSALEDLITFIYCGEVNVKNEALSTFISTAESLQIKGLTDNDAPTKTEQSSDIMQAQVITVNAPAPVAQAAPVRQQTRTVTRPATVAAPVAPAPKPRVSRQTTVESEESGAEEVVRVPAAVAAPAKRASGPAPKSVAVKRIKINAASTPTQAPSTTTTTTLAKRTAQPIPKAAEIVKTEQVLIELPMDQSAAEDEVEEEVHEDEPPQETEEDESYAKYDETYFTVNETATSDTKEISTANTTGGTSFCVEDTQGSRKARAPRNPKQSKETKNRNHQSVQRIELADGCELEDADSDCHLTFLRTPWATNCLVVGGFIYNCHSIKSNGTEYWRCHNYSKKSKEERCSARCTIVDGKIQSLSDEGHSHPPHTEKIRSYKERMQKFK